MVTIIPTHTTHHLVSRLANKDGVTIVYPETNKDNTLLFPDGEVFVALSDVDALTGRVVLLHAGMPDPNTGLVELEMLLSILEQNKEISVEVFFTYCPYSMQDKAQTGESNAAKAFIEKLINHYTVKHIYCMDPHFATASWCAEYPLTNVAVYDLLMKAAEEEHTDIVYATPDEGSYQRTHIPGAQKKRHNSYDIEIFHDTQFTETIKDNTVGIVDDLIETGGTMVGIHDTCTNEGACACIALITHGVLPAGIARVTQTYKKLYLSNTIDRPEANVCVADRIYETLLQ